MKTFLAFMKKECLDLKRSGRLVQGAVIFGILGVMNPAVAKLTPWMMELLADSLAQSGLVVGEITVDALTSWGQFFKNIPLGLIVFILMQSGIITREYQKGTLVLVLTKGLERHKVFLAKFMIVILLWTFLFWVCFGITYGYNAFYWDNSIAHNLFFGAACWWLFGLWTIAVMFLFSTIGKSTTGVLGGIGGVVLLSYLAGMLPMLKDYMPTKLMDATPLLVGLVEPGDYIKAILVAVITMALAIGAGIALFNKKEI